MATSISTLPIPTQASSDILSQATKSTDSTFKLLSFSLHYRAELIRYLLASADAKWEELPVVSP